jgi:hypothetical protein
MSRVMNTAAKTTRHKRKLSGFEGIVALRPLNALERRQLERSKRKMGRPVKGKGAQVISLSIERGLLESADRFAKERGLTRAALIAAAIMVVLKNPNLLDGRQAVGSKSN